MDAIEALKLLERRISERKIYNYRPFGHEDTLYPDGELFKESDWVKWSNKPWQLDFHNAGKDNSERLLLCANGVGKTIAGSAETAIHLTGDYPDWWDGHRFEKPPFFWIGSITNETQREITQVALLGQNLGEDLGTGYIPKEKIVGKVKTRQAGISDVADQIMVRHSSGGISKAVFKVYEQGWRKWQGAAPDGIYLDEEPDDYRIYEECQTRVIRTNGIIYCALTPLLGETELIRHFIENDKGIWWSGATWDDVPHLNEVRKKQLIDTYRGASLETRTKGIPMMGSGRIFTTNEDEIKIAPVPIKPYYARIKGIDFGSSHPCAVVDLAIDLDQQIVYVTRCWRKKTEDISEHCEAINEVNPWVPVAWPHDGVNHQKGGKQLKQYYLDHRVKLLSKSACYKNDTLGSQPVMPIIMKVNEMAANGQLRVFSTCHDFFDEWRNYHYDDQGKPVNRKDDVLKAFFYALMMKRYATMKQVYHRDSPDLPSISMQI